MSAGFCFKTHFIFGGISAQHQYVVDAEVVQVDECILGFIDAESAADQVRDGIDIVFIEDGGADAFGAGAFADHYFFKSAVGAFFENVLAAVIGHVDESRLVCHEGIEVFVQRLNAFSFQRRQHLKGDQGVFRPLDVFDYFHRRQK